MGVSYSALVFDLFGTLVPTYRHHDVLSEMAVALGLDSRGFISAFVGEARDSRETGETSLDENLRQICDTLGHVVTNAQIARAIAVRRQFTHMALTPRDDALETLSHLRAKGLSIGLISDCCELVSALWEGHRSRDASMHASCRFALG
jgi:FMN phosphatase YigB (HAD superfamily)